jgi:hypothetical protein
VTIVVAAAAPDGIVLASDSRTTLTSGRRHRIASDHARKLFAPCDGIGIATFGTALINEQTISGIVEEFVASRSERAGTAVMEVSEDLASYFTQVLGDARPTPPPGVLGFLVAGYDTGGVGHVVEVLLPPSDDRKAVLEHNITTRGGGVLFRGRTTYVRRMLEGYDRDGFTRSDVALPGDVEHELQRLGYQLNKTISAQDALDLAAFIVRMTIDMERLTDGTYAQPGDIPACGGPMQALLVTRTGTDWLVRPSLRPSAAGLAEAG